MMLTLVILFVWTLREPLHPKDPNKEENIRSPSEHERNLSWISSIVLLTYRAQLFKANDVVS